MTSDAATVTEPVVTRIDTATADLAALGAHLLERAALPEQIAASVGATSTTTSTNTAVRAEPVTRVTALPEIDVPDVTLPSLTDDFAPVLGLLVLPGLPPLGPNPGPPVPPLTWAFVTWSRRYSDTLFTADAPVTDSARSGQDAALSVPDAIRSFFAVLRAKLDNSTPVAEPSTPTQQDGVVTGSLNASDRENDRLGYTVTTQPTNGTVVVDADGRYTYTPNDPGSTTSDSFVVTISDNTNPHLHGLFNPASHETTVEVGLTYTATPTNSAPGKVTVTDQRTDAETGVVTGTLNATDPDGDPVTFGALGKPDHGTVEIDGNTFTYTPDEDYRFRAGANGGDKFDTITIVATDDLGNSSATQLDVEVSATDIVVVSQTGSYGQLTMSPDGRRAYFATEIYDRATGKYLTRVSVVETATGNRTDLGTQSGEARALSTSPDGTLLYLSTDQYNSFYESVTWVSVIDTATGEQRYLANQSGKFHDLTVSPDGSRAYLTTSTYDSAAGEYSTHFTVIDTATGEQTVLATQTGDYPIVRFTPDGSRAYVMTAVDGADRTNITVVDTDSGQTVAFTQSGYSPDVEFTPDGKYSYVETSSYDRDAAQNLIHISVVNTATGQRTTTVTQAGSFGDVTFSPDGTRAYLVTRTYVQSTGATTTHVGVIDAATGNLTDLTSQFGEFRDLTLTADGTRAYLSTDRHDTTTRDSITEVTVVDLATGVKTPVTTQAGGFENFTVSSDGSRAFLTTQSRVYFDGWSYTSATQISAVDLATGERTVLANQPGELDNITFSSDGSKVYLTTETMHEKPYTVYFSVIDTGTGTQHTVITKSGAYDDFVVSPDGSQAYLVTMYQDDTGAYTAYVRVIDLTTVEATDPVPHSGSMIDGRRVADVDGDQYLLLPLFQVDGTTDLVIVRAPDGNATPVA